MKKPVRILQVFGRMDRGGAETMMMDVYRNIDRNKIQFDFLVHTQDKCAFDDEILSLGGRIYRVPKYRVYNHFQYIKSVRKVLEEYEFKLAHFHFFTMVPILYQIFQKKKIKIISHSHTSNIEKGFKGLYQRSILKKKRKIKVEKIACSRKAGEFIYNNDDFIIFKNGIEIKRFIFNSKIRQRLREELNIKDKIVIGHVGSIYEPKNHSFLIDIFFEFQKIKRDSVLILVGDGHLRNKIEKKVQKYKLNEKVLFLGVRNDVDKILNSFDIFVFPSLYEGLPVSLIEAQANGLRCIVSDRVPQEVKITDLVDFLPLEKGAKYWAEYIVRSLDYERKGRYEEIVKAGYDINENAKWLENFYLELLNKK